MLRVIDYKRKVFLSMLFTLASIIYTLKHNIFDS